MTTDAELLRRWREGDVEAANLLFDRYYPALVRFFGNKVTEDPSDLVQATFATFVENRDRIEASDKVREYLFGVAYNVLRAHVRRKYRVCGAGLDSRSLYELDPGPSTMLREAERRQQLLLALRRLPVVVQAVLELKYWEDMTSAGIAGALGLKRSTVRSHLRRGRLALGRIIGTSDVDD